jgi:hypothetical protein
VLSSHELTYRSTSAHDPSGRWPDERGFAVFGTSEAFVRTLARSFDQFAFYFVDDIEVRVVRCNEGASLVGGERHGH